MTTLKVYATGSEVVLMDNGEPFEAYARPSRWYNEQRWELHVDMAEWDIAATNAVSHSVVFKRRPKSKRSVPAA